MANFKAVVRGERKDGFMQVYIRVTHRRVHGYIKTDKMITKKELSKSKEIKDPFVLNWCSERILEFNDRLNKKDISRWTVAEVVEYLKTGEDDICFSDYARHHIDRMVDRYQLRTAQNYRQALGHMERFYGTNKIMFGQLTSTQITRWIQSLEHTHRAKEMYPVCMRQVFKAAVEEYNDYEHQGQSVGQSEDTAERPHGQEGDKPGGLQAVLYCATARYPHGRPTSRTGP